MTRLRLAAGLRVALLAACAAPAAQTTLTTAVDAIVQPPITSGQLAGASIAVVQRGRPLLTKEYGFADLELNVPTPPNATYEIGSVTKQFTAAAILLLAQRGRLSLDDDVRRYIPELPQYATPIRLRQMLNHTSGLRDWGTVVDVGGWPRGSRVHTHAHVVDILSRQTALNFTPGTRWSYSNSGYNLAAILVARVSGMSFADFTRQRIFEPLAMTSTSWRDDHTRVVPRRALAYSHEDDGYHTDMPFENVHGNGGLLTTVGDLLRWTANLETHKIGGPAFVTEQTTPGRFVDGRAHDYGMGLWMGKYRGVREIRHSGSTAGYRAYLATFPDQETSVAVLCNAANADAAALTYKVADRVLGSALAPAKELTGSHTLTDAESAALAGLYRHKVTGVARRIVKQGSDLRVERGPILAAQTATTLVTAQDERWVFDGRGGLRITDRFGTVDDLDRVEPVTPTVEALRAYEGRYASADAEVTLTVAADGDGLIIRRRPDSVVRLTPLYADAFSSSLGTVIFRRNEGGGIGALSVSQDRVWDMRFEREP